MNKWLALLVVAGCSREAGLQLVAQPSCGAACGKRADPIPDPVPSSDGGSVEPDLLPPLPPLPSPSIDPSCGADPITGLDLCFGPGGIAAPWSRSQSPDAAVWVWRNFQLVAFEHPADAEPWTNASSVALAADGKLVTASAAAVTRYLPDGTPDPTFDPVTLPVVGWRTQVALDPGGGIVIAGYGGSGCWVRRVLEDGSLTSLVERTSFCSLGALAVAPDGTIVAAGHEDGSLLLVRVAADGQISAIAHDLTADDDRATALALLPDGKIVIAGYSKAVSSNARHSFLVRLDEMGALDPSFANTPVIKLLPYNDVWTAFHALVVLPDGKLLAAGESANMGLVIRFTADGVVDTSFGGTMGRGWKVLDIVDYIHSLTLDGNGKVIAGCQTFGEGPGFGVLFRFAADSAAEDLSWKRMHFETHHFDSDVAALRLQPDGKLIVAGGFDGRLLLARLYVD